MEKFKKAFELNGSAYNLACLFALTNKKDEALQYLEISLKNKEISIEHIQSDDDWEAYAMDADFNSLLKKYT